MSTSVETNVRLIASSGAWIEGEAVRQLYAGADLPGMEGAVGFPDLHAGKGGPIGAAFLSRDTIYPHLVGNDIGCGMAFYTTDLPRRKAKLDRWVDKLHYLEHPWEGNVRQWLENRGLPFTPHDEAHGTIGGGNHFAELQAVEKIHDRQAWQGLNLPVEDLFLLVHSGSRGLGQSIWQSYAAEHGDDGCEIGSEAAIDYLGRHDLALRWAKASRELIAYRFARALGSDIDPVWDGCHNSITRWAAEGETLWLHRKGAAPADDGIAVIPGSRGSMTYLVKTTSACAETFDSLAHGAGRKWTRSASRARMRERFSYSELVQTGLGGRVICDDRNLLYEEAPEAFKKIEAVIHDMVKAGLVEVIATLRPMITYKTRAARY